MSLNRIFRIATVFVFAATFLLSPPLESPAQGEVGSPWDPAGITEDNGPLAYPDYIEVNPEDRQTEIEGLKSAFEAQGQEIRATSEYTVTLGAWRNLRPTESYLRDVSLLSPEYEVDCQSPDQESQGWIVGDAGTILSYCNGVWDHAIIPESIPTRMWGVQAILPTLSVAVGEQGAIWIYRYDITADDWIWTKYPIPVSNQTLFRVSMVEVSPQVYTGWAVGAADAQGHPALVRGNISWDSGSGTFVSDWQDQTLLFSDLPQASYYYGLQMLTPTNGWAVGGTPDVKGVILHWNGDTWSEFQQIGNQPILGIEMLSANNGWAVGMGGEIYHYTGSTWNSVASPTNTQLVDIAFDPDGVGWAVGFDGTIIWYQQDYWEIFPGGSRTDAFDFRAIDFSSGHGWLVGMNQEKSIGGQILEYQEDLWLAVTPPTDNQLNAISVVSDSDAWAVGAADGRGGTIIHWDGRHWQRWYQDDLPIPAVDLYTVDMISANDGWAAGDPSVAGAPAIILQWDGHRWAQPRYDSPVNVRINDIAMVDWESSHPDMQGWAVATSGNAVAKYNGTYWSANPTCQGVYYDLRSVSIVPDLGSLFGWDAWSVGTSLNPASGEYFMRYQPNCGASNAWDTYQHPLACAPVPSPDDGASQTKLRAITITPDGWGYAGGNYKDRASIYFYDETSGTWDTVWCHAKDSTVRPSLIYSTDIVEESGVTWFGGYYFSTTYKRKVAFIQYKDATGFRWAGTPFPLNGVNIYDRPIRGIDMSSDTMGWAMGDPEDTGKRSVIYQYPYPNFILNILPEKRAVRPGESAEYTVTANSIGGFNANVSLELLDLPVGLTGNVTPGSINAGTPANISLQISASAQPGVHEIPLLGYSIFQSGDVQIPVWRISYLTLTVTDHPIYSLSPDRGPAGTDVTISGANFGTDPGVGNRSTNENHITWAGVQLPDTSVISWSDDQIHFIPPDNPTLFSPQKFPLVGVVIVTASGETSNADFYFQMEPEISSLDSAPDSGRILVTLTGTSFGSDPGPLFRGTSYEHISLGGNWIQYLDVASWENTEIQFYVDENTLSGQVVVTTNGYESNPVAYYKPGDSGDQRKVYLPMLRRQ